MKKLLACLLIAVTAVTITACGSNPAGISLEEFDELEIGMSLSTVTSTFGGSFEEGTIVEISESDNSTDDYYEKVYVYKVTGETTGYAELEFTYYKKHDELSLSVNGLTAKTQYDLSYTQQSNIEVEDYTLKTDNSILNESPIEETTEFDYSDLSNEEFAEKIANDFSTEDVTFTIREYSDDICFLNSNSENVSAMISFSDYGNDITLSFVTEGGEDECYYVLLKALQSEVFNIPLDDQMDILAQYTVDEIDYKKSSLRIIESIKGNIRVIGICL